MRITCLDFETANFSNLSICAAGIPPRELAQRVGVEMRSFAADE